MPNQNLLVGFEELQKHLEEFIHNNAELLDTEWIDNMRNQLRNVKTQKKFTYPPPLIRVVDNGHFDRE